MPRDAEVGTFCLFLSAHPSCLPFVSPKNVFLFSCLTAVWRCHGDRLHEGGYSKKKIGFFFVLFILFYFIFASPLRLHVDGFFFQLRRSTTSKVYCFHHILHSTFFGLRLWNLLQSSNRWREPAATESGYSPSSERCGPLGLELLWRIRGAPLCSRFVSLMRLNPDPSSCV